MRLCEKGFFLIGFSIIRWRNVLAVSTESIFYFITTRISNIFEFHVSWREFDGITSCELRLLKETICLKSYVFNNNISFSTMHLSVRNLSIIKKLSLLKPHNTQSYRLNDRIDHLWYFNKNTKWKVQKVYWLKYKIHRCIKSVFLPALHIIRETFATW